MLVEPQCESQVDLTTLFPCLLACIHLCDHSWLHHHAVWFRLHVRTKDEDMKSPLGLLSLVLGKSCDAILLFSFIPSIILFLLIFRDCFWTLSATSLNYLLLPRPPIYLPVWPYWYLLSHLSYWGHERREESSANKHRKQKKKTAESDFEGMKGCKGEGERGTQSGKVAVLLIVVHLGHVLYEPTIHTQGKRMSRVRVGYNWSSLE